jgi:flagellar hook-basal body complex protein FliE
MILTGVAAASATPFVPPTTTTGSTPAASGSTFTDSLNSVTGLTSGADNLAQGVATGQLTDVHSFTTAAAKAQLGVELTVSLRNRAVEAYQEIMRMQV